MLIYTIFEIYKILKKTKKVRIVLPPLQYSNILESQTILSLTKFLK